MPRGLTRSLSALCHRAIRGGVGLAAAVGLSAFAAAQEPARADPSTVDLEALMAVPVETVSAASKHDESAATAPASVSIVSRRQIRDLGYRTLGEALAGVRGLFTTYDRTYTYLGLRGFQQPGDYNVRVLVLVDGHQWNEDIWDSALLGPEFGVDLDLVERIEVVRGPSSSMYGANALLGIVNVVTRSAESLRPAELTASAASAEAYAIRVSGAVVSPGGAEAVVSASGSAVAGQDLRFADFADSPSGGWARGRDWERWRSFLAKASWRGLTLEVAGSRRDKGDPTGAFGVVFDDPTNRVSDRRLFAEARWTAAPSDAVETTVRAYYDTYQFYQWYAYAGATPATAPVVNHDDNHGWWMGAELKTVARIGGGWLLVAGAEGKYQPVKQLAYYDGTFLSASDRRAGRLGSAYAQLEVPAAAWLKATAGARYDRVDDFAAALSPRLALLAAPRPGTVVKALYGRAFRPPNQAERYYDAPSQRWEANPAIRPEVLDTWELAVDQAVGPGLQLGAAGYRYAIRGMIGTVVNPVTGMSRYANTGTIRAEGLELEGQLHRRTATLRASVALQRAGWEGGGAPIANAPHTLAKLQLTGPLGLPGLRGGGEVLYTGRRVTLAGATASEHAVVNLNVVAAGLLRGALDLSFGVRNVLGVAYGDPAYGPPDVIQQDGRTWRASATWRL